MISKASMRRVNEDRFENVPQVKEEEGVQTFATML